MRENIKYYSANIIFSVLVAYLWQTCVFGESGLLYVLLTVPIFYCMSLYSCSKFIAATLGSVLAILYPALKVAKISMLSSTVIDVALTTNNSEVWEFYSYLPIGYLVRGVALLLAVLLFACLCKRVKPNSLNKLIPVALIIVVAVNAFHAYKPLHEFYKDITALQNFERKTPSWHVTGINSRGKHNYVLVLGESCRSDFMNLYGFEQYDTTPFLNGVNKKYIKSFIAPAVNTTLSVPRLLALSKGYKGVAVENNVISLAHENGMKSYWLSTQGFSGKFNVSSSQIADYAENKIFMRSGEDDFKLIPKLHKILREDKARKLIVLHMMGSHVSPSARLYGYPSKYKSGKGEYVDSYISTVCKTDEFLKQVCDGLKGSGESWSIIYLSDHGVNMVRSGNGYKELRDDKVQTSYRVPFIRIDDNYTESNRIEITQSGYNFPKYFATWIGVKTNLTPAGYDIFVSNEKNPKVMDYKKRLHSFSNLHIGATAATIVNEN